MQELPKLERELGDARVDWSLAGAGEESGGATDLRGEQTLAIQRTSECSEKLKDPLRMLREQRIDKNLTEKKWEMKSQFTAEIGGIFKFARSY